MIRVHVQGMHRGGGLGERSGRYEQMVEDMKEMVAGLRFEDRGAETGSRVTTTGVTQDGEEAPGKIRKRR